MAKQLGEIVTKFRSMTANVRDNISDACAFSLHFDIFRNGRLSPNRTYTTFTDGSEKVEKFLYAKNDASGYSLYGLGDDGSGKPEVFEAGLSDTAWTTFLALSSGAKDTRVFFEYKDYLYGFQGGDSLWRINVTGSPSVTDQYKALSYTNIAQPVHHKADDIAYFFQDNLVHTLNDTVWVASALTLPTNMKIMGGGAYNNYLVIVCSPIQPGTTNSVMYLWDRDSSLTTISHKVDLGMGEVVHVSEAEDGGIFITQQVTSLSGHGNYNNSIAVKYYAGFLEELEIPNGTETEYFQDMKLKGNATEDRNTFYFPAVLTTRLAQETKNVIFAVKRTQRGLSIIADQNITGVTASQYINGIFMLSGHWYISYDTASRTLITKGSSLYPTATYESLIFSDGDSSATKKLLGVTVMTSPLPTAGTTKMYYRIDNETSWTEIMEETDDGSVSHSAVNIESTGANLPEYKEIQFKIESTGGAEITGYKYKSDFIDKDLY